MTATSTRVVLPLVLAVGAASLVVAQIAAATHPRPRGASPARISLVPAFKQCTTPNRTHGTPLAFPSCSPPVQASDFLTVGTPDANGAGANAVGFLQLTVKTTAPEDILITTSISDVRCKAATSSNVCNSPNAAGGPDYSGQLQSNATIRMTDHFNGSSGNEAATVVDIPFPINYQCVNTADTSVGGTCSVNTSALVAMGIPNQDWWTGKRVVVELTQMKVFDGGADGVISTEGNTLFEIQGIFIP
jgi:hypothetical protein